MPYYVYILLCKDGSYYTGYAKDVNSRFERHTTGQGAEYTRLHRPEKIVYAEEFNSQGEAMRREKKIKTLTHSQKQRLIESQDDKNG